MSIKRKYLHRLRIKAVAFWRDRNVGLYLFFVVVATLFWFLHSLGKEYVSNIDVDVKYKNFPMNKEPQESVVRNHRLNVKAYGFSLMRVKLNSLFSNYKIDLSELRRRTSAEQNKLHYDLSISAVRNQLEGQLGAGISINSIFPEDVAFRVQTMRIKKLPIRANIKVEMQSGYMLEEKPQIMPDSIQVRGPIEIVDTLQAVYTRELFLNDVASSFKEKVHLYVPNKEIRLLQKTATVKYEVGAYIDEERLINIKALNFPDSVNVVLRPTVVKLNYRTKVDMKRTIHNDDFVLIVDYNTINEYSQKLEVQAISLPQGISKVHMTPRYVDYFISYKK